MRKEQVCHCLAMLALVLSAQVQAGSCNFVQDNMFAGPYNVCAAPVSELRCNAFEKEGSNLDVIYKDQPCSGQLLIGVCQLEQHSISYYNGDKGALETGCGFQGGEWR